MRQEIRIFFTALMFYTRIPCPAWVDHSAEYLNKATRYFPLMGWIVGGFGAVLCWGLAQVLPVSVAIVLSMIGTILLTGAFHEDGLGDVCDGFGGGWTRENILTIMKDSRMGAYGVIGLVLILLLKHQCLSTFLTLEQTLMALLVAHPLSRLVAVAMIYTMEYARENDADGKAKPVAKQMPLFDFLTASFFGLAPLGAVIFLTGNVYLLLLIAPLIALKKHLEHYFNKWINGYTGDCLGTTQQVAEVVVYLSLLAVWKFC